MSEGVVPPISQTAGRLPIPTTESPTKSPKSPQPKVVFQPQVPKKSSPSYFLGQWTGNKFPKGASVQVAGICSEGEDFTSERDVLARAADENGEFVEILDTSWASRIFDGLPFKMALRCSKGKKNFTANPAPNQDNYSITKFFSGMVVTAICDGHGPFGHWVSYRLAQTLPYYLSRDALPALPCDASGKAKIDAAFASAQEDVLSWCEQLRVDLSCSGSTATVVLLQDKLGHSAWCGDSPVLTVDGAGEVNITPSHNPNDPEELKRIEAAGGDVNVQKQPPRIYRPGSHLPGLCVSRALGDAGMSDIGVSYTPSHQSYSLSAGNTMIAGSDGLFEFISARETKFWNKIAKQAKKDVHQAVEQVTKFSRQLWAKVEEEYCDDITGCVYHWP
jgi:serine/threonine protein phosphatase PrpC